MSKSYTFNCLAILFAIVATVNLFNLTNVQTGVFAAFNVIVTVLLAKAASNAKREEAYSNR